MMFLKELMHVKLGGQNDNLMFLNLAILRVPKLPFLENQLANGVEKVIIFDKKRGHVSTLIANAWMKFYIKVKVLKS